jgi:hypothetical protein
LSNAVSALSDADPFELCAASACETFVPSERSFVQLADAENEYDEDDDELELELEELDEELLDELSFDDEEEELLEVVAGSVDAFLPLLLPPQPAPSAASARTTASAIVRCIRVAPR